MPSQNLPKPNLPGQLQTQSVAAPQANVQTAPVAGQAQATASINPPTPPNTPISNQTVFSAKAASPTTPQMASMPKPPAPQVVPAGLSRENPGGTPPKMQVVAPAQNLAKAQLGPTGIVAPENTMPQVPVNSLASPIQTSVSPVGGAVPNQLRPASPLNQINLPKTPQVDKQNPSMAASAASTAVQPSPSMSVSHATSAVANAGVVQSASAPSSATNSTANSPTSSAAATKATEPVSSVKKPFKLPLPALIAGGILLLAVLGWVLWSVLKPKTSTSTPTSKPTNTNTATTGASTGTGSSGQTTILTYWGLWEDSQILKEVIADFESKNPSIKIDYRKQSHRDYRERLQQAIASGSGPDIFRYHVAWVPMLSAELAPLPSSVMSTAEYKQIFYPTAFNNLQVGGQIVGIPLMYDGLALLYNKEMLRTANLEVPTTWAELRSAATKLTVPANVSERQNGNITRSGLAIGNAGNVDHFSDILALLIVQNGGTPTDPTSQYVKDAVTFYTNFMKQDKIWSERLANSTTAFAKGDVAMIFAPSWRIHEIKTINPELDFGVARLPQLDSEKPITWATFWAEGVSSKSKNKDAAWAFLKYLSTAEVLRKFYTDASQYRAFGEIFPRTDMASELQNSDLVAAYVTDAPLAKSWYLSSFTHDNGLNDQIIKYYEDAVNAVLTGTNIDKALETAKTGVTSVLTKYSSKAN